MRMAMLTVESWVKGPVHIGKAWDAGTGYDLYTSGTVPANDMCDDWGSGGVAEGKKLQAGSMGLCSRDSYPAGGGGEQSRPS